MLPCAHLGSHQVSAPALGWAQLGLRMQCVQHAMRIWRPLSPPRGAQVIRVCGTDKRPVPLSHHLCFDKKLFPICTAKAFNTEEYARAKHIFKCGARALSVVVASFGLEIRRLSMCILPLERTLN
jgi:hypothetical protein